MAAQGQEVCVEDLFIYTLAIKGNCARQHFVQHAAEGIRVRAPINGLPWHCSGDIWCGVPAVIPVADCVGNGVFLGMRRGCEGELPARR